LGWSAYKYYSAREEKARAASINEFNYPRATEGDPIPIIYGTVRVRSPIIVWLGDFTASEASVGFVYTVGMRLLLGRGNADVGAASGFATLEKVYIGDKEATLIPSTLTDPAHATSYFVQEADLEPGQILAGTAGALVFYDG